MSLKETHILIATRGYLNDEVRVEKVIIDENDMEEADFKEFDEYADYVLEEAAAEYQQGFSEVFIITESQLPNLINELSKIQSIKS